MPPPESQRDRPRADRAARRGGRRRAATRTAYARLQEVGKIAGNRSSFDVRNHGFSDSSDLMEARRDNFKLERREGNQILRQAACS